MKILVNRKTRVFLSGVGMWSVVSALLCAAAVYVKPKYAAVCVLLCSFLCGCVVLVLCIFYVRQQEQIIETAKKQITDYIAGNENARIACNDEGELYRLFHEVNSLAAILNARAQNELRTKEFLKDTISDISHQLKTPLAALNIYNGILKEEGENMPTVQQFSELTEQELDRIEALVQNLLKITKLDAGTIVMDKRQEKVSAIMETVRKHFLFRAGQEEKEIRLAGDENITLFCDVGWLLEAFDNLVKNALDHTKAGDTVTLEWRKSAAMVQISVSDNGSGIHPEDLYHIFKRFYRSRFSKDTQGIGLGLPFAKAVIEAHNGSIEVQSDLGSGTIFLVNFLIS